MSKTKQNSQKYVRVVLFFIFLAAVIFLIIRHINAFGNILLVMLGFGAVVLVHEFGHFIVAKLSNIKVEAFSIFMPPILIGVLKTEKGLRFRILPEIFKKDGDESDEGQLTFTIGSKGQPGETEYRIGLIPFGGFVKMMGQDDIGPVKESQDPRSFANKPVHTRAASIAAGVVFNIISAVIVFMITFLIGIDLQPPVVGLVVPDSPAAVAGLVPGDEIIEIKGKSTDIDFSNVAIAGALSGEGQEIPMRVRHTDGTESDYKLAAAELPGEPLRSFGILAADSLTIAELTPEDANNLFASTGLLPGDHVVSINGQDIRGNWELMEILQSTIAPEVTILADRKEKEGQTRQIETKIQLDMGVGGSSSVETESDLANVYSMVPRLQIMEVQDIADSSEPNSISPLQAGDIILAVGDVINPLYTELRETVSQYKDTQLPIQVLRMDDNGQEQILNLTITPRQPQGSDRAVIGVALALDVEHPVVARTISSNNGYSKLDIPAGATITDVDGEPVATFYDIVGYIAQYPGERISLNWRIDEETAGSVAIDVDSSGRFISVQAGMAVNIPFDYLKRTYKANGPINAIAMGYRRTVMFVAQTYVTLRRLVTGLVSPKNLMGPIGIMRFSYEIVSRRPAVYYIYFLGLMSATIAVFNFLPLPPLDGGLIVLLLIEKIKGSALSEKTQTIIAYAGWLMIMALFLYVTFNDIMNINGSIQ